MINPLWQDLAFQLANERFDSVIDFLIESGYYDESKVADLTLMRSQWTHYWKEYNLGLKSMTEWFRIQDQLRHNLNHWFDNIPATYYKKNEK